MILLTALAALAAIVSAIIFGRQLTVMSYQLSAMRDQQKTMDTQTRIMQSQQRPWLSVDAIPEQINSTGFGFNTDGSLSIFFKLKIKNVGQAVAEGVYVNVVGIVVSENGAPGEKENSKIIASQNDACTIAKLLGSDPRKYGFSLFPGDERIETEMALIEAPEIKKNIVQTIFGPAVHPIIAGCVDYHFFVTPDHHQTPFAFEATRNDWVEMEFRRMTKTGIVADTFHDNGYLILGQDVPPKHTSFEKSYYGNSDVK